ncbi:MAG: ABC transporter ATP-binding protein [Ruminococcaceae bacterium]|nr:ABC transporter ATP-binding protein [Oscillospiraceae bacterium]
MLFGKHINKYYLRYAPMLILGLVALIVVDYFQLLIPEIYRSVINGINDGYVVVDGVTHEFNIEFLLDKVCLPMIFVIVALVVGRFAWRICFFGSAIKVETDLRGRMFDHCKDLSQSYYQVNKVGNLMSLFTNDLRTVEECFGSGVLSFFDALLLGCLALYKMFKMDYVLTLLSLIPMAMLIVVATIVRKYMMKKWTLRQEAFSALSDYAQESFSGIAVIKAFVKEARELWAFKKLSKKNEDANVDHTKASTLLHIFVTLFVESVICVIIGYGGYLVYNGRFNAGEFVEFIGYFNTIVWPIMAISQLIEMQSRGKASLNRISELLDAKIDVCDKEDVQEIKAVRGEIEFKNLTFRYPDASFDALKDICLKINAGENVGIIGKTGAGKTTLVDLILRTYNVENGTLFVDGVDVNQVPIKNLREFCAYVPQDNFLFSDTIENNIAFATNESELDVQKAARLADIHKSIEGFSQGYQTVLGERGVTVSGGQKQRISIARALMKNAPVLILDDSVSAVDTKTEKIIIENLKTVRKDKTTILIAHRVSTIEKMDKIVYIDDGEIVATGTHDELYENCKDYRNMVELQRLDEEKEAM